MNKLTLTMLALSLGLGGLAYYEFEKSKEEKEIEAREAMIVGWPDAKFASAKLVTGDRKIEVERRDGKWWTVQPLEDFADQFNVNSWVTDIAQEKGRKLEAKTDSSGNILWSEYGLDGETRKISLKKSDGAQAQLEVAQNSAFDGSFFIKYQNAVYLGSRPWAGVLAKTIDSLRSKDVFRDEGLLSRVKVSIPGQGNFAFVNAGVEEWSKEGDKNFKLDNQQVLAFTRQMKGLRIKSFVDGEKKLEKLSDYGLKNPLAKFEVKKGETEYKLSLGKAKRGDVAAYYAKVNGQKGIYELNEAAAKALVKPITHYMDKSLPFQFDISQAKELEIRAEGQVLKVKKDHTNWILSNGASKNLDNSQLEDFLTSMKTLRAKEYTGKAKKSPGYTNQLVVRDTQGKEIYKFAWTKDSASDSIYKGVSSLIDLGFTLQASQWKDWKVENFFKKAEENGNKKEETSEAPVSN